MLKNYLQQDVIKELFYYDPVSGDLYDKVKRRGRNIGDISTVKSKEGYLKVYINNTAYMAHVLIWIYVFNEIPTTIDHKNGIKDDNRISNLRNVNHRINMQNQKSQKQKEYSNVPGVIYDRDYDKYRVRLRVDGINKSFGIHDTVEEAEEHCINMRRIYYPGNTL